MKCKYGDIWLTGEAPGEEMRENLLRLTQALATPPIGGASGASLQAYGNRWAELPVTLIQEHAGDLEALLYIHTLPWLLPESATLLLEEGTRSWSYAVAAWSNLQAVRDKGPAVALQITFAVTGPATIT